MNNGTQRKCLSAAEIELKLRDAGIQPTAQRIAIGRYVLCEAYHPTAEQVKAWADENFPKVSLATVYNTLNALVKAGLLIDLKLPHSDKVFFDNNPAEHYHFLDEDSGELVDIPKEMMDVVPKLNRGFDVRRIDVVLRGTRR